MYKIPEQYKVGVIIALKDFMPKDLKPEQKKRIKDSIKKVQLTYQIAGEEIPSVVNTEYRCQVIQFYDIEIRSMKDASFLATIYQGLIKPLCVIRLHDSMDEAYSLSLKRLNQQDNTQIVVECSEMTESYPVGLPDAKRDRLFSYIEFAKVKNKSDKINFYKEIYTKIYLLNNEKSYANTVEIMDSNVWYDAKRTGRILSYYKGLVEERMMLTRVVSNAEKVSINQRIKEEIKLLDEERY
nr:DUF4391 domain-containing protein [uncultured Anaerosporobacter sp.]